MSIKDLVPWRHERAVDVRRLDDALPAFHRAFDSLFDEFFRSFGLVPSGRFFDEPWGLQASGLDFDETDSAYTVSTEVPGWDEKDIEVTVSGDTLTIRGQRQEEVQQGEKGAPGYRVQRSSGSFQRSTRIPDGVDRDRISATCSRGVLTVTLPKTEQARQQTRKIEVKAA